MSGQQNTFFSLFHFLTQFYFLSVLLSPVHLSGFFFGGGDVLSTKAFFFVMALIIFDPPTRLSVQFCSFSWSTRLSKCFTQSDSVHTASNKFYKHKQTGEEIPENKNRKANKLLDAYR